MKRRRASVKNFLDELRDGRARGPVLREGRDLLLSGNLAGDEEPEERLRKRLAATGGFGKLRLAVGDGQAAEADALVCNVREAGQIKLG